MISSLPDTPMVPEIEVDTNTYYVLRLTPGDAAYTMDDITDMLNNDLIISFIFSKEIMPKIHFHAFIEIADESQEPELREIIKKFIDHWYPKKDRKRGFGNAQSNLAISYDKNKAIQYLLKDKIKYEFSNYTQEFVDERIKDSFQKKSTECYDMEFIKLREECQTTEMSAVKFIEQYSLLISRYDRTLNHARAYEYYKSFLIKRDPSQATIMAEKYLAKYGI